MNLDLRAFLTDESGNATGEYALVMTAFALLILGTTALVTGAAGGALNSADTQLNNRNGITPN